MKISIPQHVLIRTIDPILREINSLTPTEQLHIDLSAFRWTEPAGLLPVTSKLRTHVHAGGEIVVDRFPDDKQCAYLERMNFYRILGISCPHSSRRLTKKDTYIAITELGSHNLTESARKRLDTLVSERVGVSDVLGDSFLTACGELVENTKHAYNSFVDRNADKWPQALLQCQYYGDKNSLHVCVADSGLGIKRSIGAKEPDLYDDKKAIEAALVLGMRGGKGSLPGKGLGLAAIRRFMKRNRGRFLIRSGDCLALVGHNRRTYAVPHWKGTVITLEINTRREVDISVIIEQMEKGK